MAAPWLNPRTPWAGHQDDNAYDNAQTYVKAFVLEGISEQFQRRFDSSHFRPSSIDLPPPTWGERRVWVSCFRCAKLLWGAEGLCNVHRGEHMRGIEEG